MKHSDTQRSSNTPTILIDDWGTLQQLVMFRIFHNGWIDCRDASIAVLYL